LLEIKQVKKKDVERDVTEAVVKMFRVKVVLPEMT